MNEKRASAPEADRAVESASQSFGKVFGEESAITNGTEPVPLTRQAKTPRSWYFAFCLLVVVYFATSGFPHLFDQIDGQYAGAAREMMMSGNWLTPTQDGVPRLQKPPLVYWCEIGSMTLFGINEFGARFPVIAATVAWFVATGMLAFRISGRFRTAVAASLILAMFMGSYVFNHLVMPEPFLGCFLALSFWCLASALQAGREKAVKADHWLMGAWFFISLGALSKGLHAFIFPVAVALVSAALKPETRKMWWRFLCRPHGWLLFLLLLLPWYLYTESRFPGFLKDHFLNEQLGSVVRRRWPPDSDHVSLPVFWLQHLGLFFPITLLLPAAISATLAARRAHGNWLLGEWHLLVIWFLLNAIGISFANVQDYYLMTAWPVVAIWVAWALSSGEVSRYYRFVGGSLITLCFLGLIMAFYLSWQYLGPRSGVVGGGSGRDDTILEVLQGFPSTILEHILPLLWLSCGGAMVTGLVLVFYCRKRDPDFGLAALGIFMAGLFLLSARGFVVVQDEFSSAGVAKLIDSRASPNPIVISQGDSNENTSLFFYLHSPIFWVDGNPEMEFATRILGIGRDHYLSRARVAELWHRPQQVFLIVESSGIDQWKGMLSTETLTPLGTFGSRMVITNQ
jgi:4-amino-4-deoxy-L-arabinose transferase-like glycosyltransferase